MDEILEHDGRRLQLSRMPLRDGERLRAWDAADEYLLRNWREEIAPAAPPNARVLLINDSFGALGCALAGHRPTSWNDSHLSRLALEHNLGVNGLPDDAVSWVPADHDPNGPFELVLARFPKSLAWWDECLERVRPRLAPGAVLLGGGMIKHTPKRIYTSLEKRIGPTVTSLGWKKARLAAARLDPELAVPATRPAAGYTVPGFDLTLESAANAFSRGALDAGARLLLTTLPQGDEALEAADLGCGNGVLALGLARRCPRARVLGVDESYQAIASALGNARRAGLSAVLGGPGARFEVADGLETCAVGSLDLVVCNPPFHQGRAEGDQVAWEMFRHARRALRRGGRLLVVGNRHLGYHWKLERLFDRCRTISSDRRFVVLEAE